MNQTETINYQALSHSYLMAALEEVRENLLQKADPNLLDEKLALKDRQKREISPQNPSEANSEISNLDRLCLIFGLSNFERNLLLLCAGVEINPNFGLLCGAIRVNKDREYATFALAMTIFENPDWTAFTPAGSLRKWRLIEIGNGTELMLSPLRIDEQILHYLMGISHLEESLTKVVESAIVLDDLVPSHWQIAQKIVAAWSIEFDDYLQLPVLQLCGNEIASKRAIASVASHFLGASCLSIAAHNIPTNPPELNHFKLLWEREVMLKRSILSIECDDLETSDLQRQAAIDRLCESLRSPIIINTSDRRRARHRPVLAYEIARPTSNEQYKVWQTALQIGDRSFNGQVDALVSQFNLSAPVIEAACSQVYKEWQQARELEKTVDFNLLLWDTCRAQARPKLDDLAQRIDSNADWDDLVLPEEQIAILKEISAHVKHRFKVYQNWGFGGKSRRGLGISALFSGVSGTGKTTAAEILARELRLDLYRIDLSAVISKYIGETEKNLRRVFDAAELGGVVLLFDEADALFGKRTEVKDSHDRHANVEVSYLLQRMESYQGLSVLTTNLKDSLDRAFMRRIRFIVQFPFPDGATRAEIWRRVFPQATPTEELNFKRLAQLNVAGGNIRNIAINAAFLAADANEPVTMKHILEATRSEYLKLERPLTDGEIKGWIVKSKP